MHTQRCLGFVLLLALSTGLGHMAVADDPRVAGAGSQRDRALAVLRVRMEAKLKQAELLEKAGRIAEALAVARDVERLYREGLAELDQLLGRAGAPAEPPWKPRFRLGPLTPPASRPLPRGMDTEGMGGPHGYRGLEPPALAGRPPGPTAPSGDRATLDAAMHAGLRWLAAHQSEDGGWEAAGFGRWCDGTPHTGPAADGAGKPEYDVGVTGLALCAFLGAGYGERGEHPYAAAVRKGLDHLRLTQDEEGCFGPRTTQHFIYNHACATLAMVEAFGASGSVRFRSSAKRALDFLLLARNPYFAWRYGVKPGDNDTSVTGWMVSCLWRAAQINAEHAREGKAAPLPVDPEAFSGARAWLDKMTDPDTGRVGYVARGSGPARCQDMLTLFPPQRSESMTAVGVFARILMGEDPAQSEIIRKGAALMLGLAPAWDRPRGGIDMYYWYYATLAFHQLGGTGHAQWSRALGVAALAGQHKQGTPCDVLGSWGAVDPWGPDGGRIYATALMTMCLQADYRYERVFPGAGASAEPR